ncbi:GNAT family N-acetyltransferase [Adlercreutzia sp. R21]|uniref:GNAT family N-acetyltransferase n=1 Tax=Adlercreutzia wanghongyangiae TaxID=3111451 RepID=UPI002DB6E54A|nr:GNAT family N-acetyltransferase [Adlercreutzia sp. R21]MEC4185157.1 GNAT family N-acetyltransferase [Adlercreutzia sp. R21]
MGENADGKAAKGGKAVSDRALDEASPAGPGKNHVVRGIVFAALGGICWGFSGNCAQMLTAELGVPVLWITAVRLTVAALIFLTICLVREPRNLLAALRDGRSLAYIAGFAILGVLLTQVSYLSAIAYTNAGTGTVLERTGLVLIMGYVCLRTRRLPRPREAAGLVLAIGGTVLIATQGDLSRLAIAPAGLGWGLVSAVALAFYTLMPGKPLAKWGSFIVTALAMTMGGTVAMAGVQPWTMGVTVTPAVVGVMALMVLVGTFAAYLFYLQGIADAGPVRAGLVGCVEPVSATIISALWLGTTVTPMDVLGCAMIVVMVFLVTDRGGEGDADQAAESGKGAAPSHYDGARGNVPVFQGRASELGYYAARVATRDDVPRLQTLLADGRHTMAKLGVKEGTKRFPSSRRLLRAVDAGSVYVVVSNPSWIGVDDASGMFDTSAESRIIGMFDVDVEGDEAYEEGRGLTWITEGDGNYGALHWVNVDPSARRCGVGAYILGTAQRIARDAGCHNLCCDVYEANGPMRDLLAREGWTVAGTIALRDWHGHETHRLIYEKLYW